MCDAQQRNKAAAEGDIRASIEKLEAELETLEQPGKLIFEIQSAWGTHLLEANVGECVREMAKRFCRESRLDLSLAAPVAERLEQRLRGGCPGNEQSSGPSPPKRHGPKPKVIDFGDKDAVRRRVRALQKKLREIEKLKVSPPSSLDTLQREKLRTEDEVRAACISLERELDLLERIPRMVFDVKTESGALYLEFRDGDDCLELAKQFCRSHELDKELAKPLALHMEQKLREQEILQEE